MTEWWSWQGRLVEDGRKTMIPLDINIASVHCRCLASSLREEISRITISRFRSLELPPIIVH